MTNYFAPDGGGDRRDQAFAVVISVALHLVALGWIWLGRGQGEMENMEGPGYSSGNGAIAAFLAPTEFRQRVEAPQAFASTRANEIAQRLPGKAVRATSSHVNDMPEDAQLVEPATTGARDAVVASEFEAVSTESEEVGLTQGEQRAGKGGDDGLRAAYRAALRGTIHRHWNYQGPQQHCSLIIKQSVGGAVQSAVVGEGALSPQDTRALEAAALMAQPLPYAGYEEVFADVLVLDVIPL